MKKMMLLMSLGLGSFMYGMQTDTASEQAGEGKRGRAESNDSEHERQLRVRLHEEQEAKNRLNRALLVSVKNGDIAQCKALLDAGATPLTRTANGTLALHLAASNGHFEIVKLLLDIERFGVDCVQLQVRARLTQCGNTALHLAANEVIKYRVKDPERKAFVFIAAYILRQAHAVKADYEISWGVNKNGQRYDQGKDFLSDEIKHRAQSKRWKP